MAEEKAKKQVNPAVIQAVKAVAVLVVICLVCGALLALCNDLLYIDDDTRLSRSMQKIYPEFELDKELAVDASVTSDYGKVNKVYLSKDGTYIIEALGVGGYQGGTVTLYVVIGSDAKIKGWAVKENDKQSYIDRVPASAGTTWYVGMDISSDLPLVMTGATVVATSTAINNAVNMAAYYCRKCPTIPIGSDPEGEAKNAIKALMEAKEIEVVSEFKNSKTTVENITVGDKKLSQLLAGDDETYSYTFIGVMEDGSSIAVHVFNWDASYTFDTLEGIPAATKIVVVKVDEVVASVHVEEGDALRDRVVAYPVQYVGGNAMYAYITDTTDGDNAKVYTVMSLSAWSYPSDYTLTVTIGTDSESNLGKVISIVVTKTGYVPGYPDESETLALVNGLKDATLATIDEMYESGKKANATNSANVITAAVRAALADYDAKLASAND